jgi:DNA-binding response OmpR family regulator
MKVLVAEDDVVASRVLESALISLGHEVDQYGGGREAWEAFQLERHSVVITDWMMPELDGLELCARIRTHTAQTYTYVILLTGRVGRGSYQQAIAAGVDDFLPKPLDRDLLEARLTVAQRIVGMHDHTQRLESLLHVCAWCKQIRDQDSWVSLEKYIARTGTALSHGICQTCMKRWEEEPGWSGGNDPRR